MIPVVPLHLHSHFSQLDSIIQVPNLIDFCLKEGMSSCAVTDHGNMGVLPSFYKAANEKGIKPILGEEFYLVDDMSIQTYPNGERNIPRVRFHQVLLAKNNDGYRNLLYLTSMANKLGFYTKPCIDWNILEDHSEGLICTSCCLSGLLPKAIQWDLVDKTNSNALDKFGEGFRFTEIYKGMGPDKILARYINIFKDDFYLEVQDINNKDQDIVNPIIFDYGKRLGIPVIITSDAHYYRPEDKYIHEISLCNSTKSLISDPNEEELLALPLEQREGKKKRYSFGSGWAHILTPKLLEDSIKRDLRFEEAAKNTLLVADKCNISLQKRYTLPDFSTEKLTANDILERKAKYGLAQKFGGNHLNIPKEYKDRINFELDIIKKLGFANYFLVVSDYINWSKDNNILTGAGRGCFLPNNKVILGDKTSKKISEIEVGDTVLADDNLPHRVIDTHKYKIEETILEILTEDNRVITCTLDHKILINRKNKKVWIEARYLREGDDITDLCLT